ncbi:uncharacterized protein LOC110861093 [Folsomia candida]|uniref:uncharacterized protein LOC110861093 n=1 Tax=Folsomia candida TaxID=158441 RepID=UPI000B8F66B8|nr:uncharacterized protein LOC110861093 [Folsomia candida]
MWGQLIQPLLCFGLALSCLAAPHRLGEWGNKMYFRADDTTATWDQSVTRCNYYGMKFVDINSNEELTALVGMLGPRVYWTSGKQVFDFKWATTNARVDLDLRRENETCVYITPGGFLGVFPCTEKLYTLCYAIIN